MNLLMMAKSNIKKNKNMTVTLVILVVFAAILLYIGTSIILEMNNFIDKKNLSLKGSDFTAFAPLKYEETLQGILTKMGGYDQLEQERAIADASTFRNITKDTKSQSMDFLILNADYKEKISVLKVMDKGEKKLSNSVIVPYYLKVAQGYRTGDKISITYEGKAHDFVIYGFCEDVMFALPSNISYYKCYVFGDKFRELYEESENTKYFLMKTRMPEGTNTLDYGNNFNKEINKTITDSTTLITATGYSEMKIGVSIFLIIIMVILIVFSAIIIMIALTVIRFAVVTYIEGNIKNIGSMEALGYTGRELIAGTVLQFALIALISNITGLVIAVSCTGIVKKLVSSAIGLVWNSTVSFMAIGINVIVIMLSVILISYFTAARMKKITPIMALRDGIDTHNFKKNYLPLHRVSMNVNAAGGFKNLMQNMKQNIAVFIIVTLMAIVCVFSFTSNYNLVVNNTALFQLVGLEKSHLMIKYVGKDSIRVFDEITHMNHVRKTIRLSRNTMSLYIGNKESSPALCVCNDYSLLEINSVIKGRYPVHDNEIAVTGLVLKQLKAELGDYITIKGNDSKADYLIVGITQQINNLGRGASITEAGMKRINPDYVPSTLYIHLDHSSNIASITKAINSRYSGRPLRVINMEEQYNNILESFTKAINGLCMVCIIITLLIISLVLYLLIKIKLIKERQRIGIFKALGYTTKQIIMQVIYSFSPACILGALVGTTLAVIFINPVLAGLLSVAGSIQNCHFSISPMLALTTFSAISLYSVTVTAFVSCQARKITPCELFR